MLTREQQGSALQETAACIVACMCSPRPTFFRARSLRIVMLPCIGLLQRVVCMGRQQQSLFCWLGAFISMFGKSHLTCKGRPICLGIASSAGLFVAFRGVYSFRHALVQ